MSVASILVGSSILLVVLSKQNLYVDMMTSLLTTPRRVMAVTTTTTTTTTAFVGPRSIQSGRRASHHQETSNFQEPTDSTFGRRDYWNDVYATQKSFSWYTGWEDLEPFVRELVPMKLSHVLIPGIGNDVSVRDMYDVGGYRNLTAFDYAEAGVECARTLLGCERIRDSELSQGVTLLIADARNLPFDDCSFDTVLDKGTLDAIYLSGGTNKSLAEQHLAMAVAEMERVIVKGGVVISVSAACANQVRMAFSQSGAWDELRDGSTYITEDGFASNNVDGSLLAWKHSVNPNGAGSSSKAV